MAEEIFVVEVNGRDEGNGGNDDIGGVETPAQADFEGSVGDFLAGDADALVDALEVWRSIEARAEADAAKNGFEKRGGRAFAVGAGNVRARIGAVGATEAFVEDGDVFEVEFGGRGLGRRGELAAEREKVTHGGIVVHRA